MQNVLKNKTLSSLKVPLKGYVAQKLNIKTKKVKANPNQVIKKMTMPVTFKPGITNPVPLKKGKNVGDALKNNLKSAMSKLN